MCPFRKEPHFSRRCGALRTPPSPPLLVASFLRSLRVVVTLGGLLPLCQCRPWTGRRQRVALFLNSHWCHLQRLSPSAPGFGSLGQVWREFLRCVLRVSIWRPAVVLVGSHHAKVEKIEGHCDCERSQNLEYKSHYTNGEHNPRRKGLLRA